MIAFGARHLGLLAAVCLVPLVVATPDSLPAEAACADADLVPAPDNLGRMGASITCLVNAERADRGEPPLESAAELRVPAQGMSEDMVQRKFFSHRTPDGTDMADRIAPTGYLPAADRWVLGENLAWGRGSLSTPRAIVRGWMSTTEHRANVLATDYVDIGVGVTMGSPWPDRPGGTTFTVDFGTRDTRPAVSVPSHIAGDARDAADQGISYRAECSRPCTLHANLLREPAGEARPVVLASGRLRLSVGGTGTMALELRPQAARSRLRLTGAKLKLVTRASQSPIAHTTRVTLH
ncbi:MAG: hypothetical protein QOH13_1458 [Thermoleophilaceae bacterium]|nr:hypothetical protein [Thermoleophilaceae bacterium]